MDRRGWPWRKKSSEKMPSSLDADESCPAYSARHLDDQDVLRILVDHVQTSDSTIQLQKSEEKLKYLNERLSVTSLEVLAKDGLIQQHAKVAEEAVSGWEKAEAEAVTLRQQLDAAIQQKLATEDRVLHLDGALKDCMQQLWHVRQQQEQRIHEAVEKKTRDLDKVQSELEEKLVDIGQQLEQAVAENSSMSKSLVERTKTISDMREAQSKAENEIKVLQVQLSSVEKENAASKYEIRVLNKELEIRNEEREISKRSADVASKKHLESVKKISKLEVECQQLRILVRKKLPGPAAMAQMKLEVEALGKEKCEINRRKSGGKSTGSSKVAGCFEPGQEFAGKIARKDAGLPPEHKLFMEEETKMLKEALAKRNRELQTARLMCARTASRLSSLEQQLNTFPGNSGMSGLDLYLKATRSVSKEASMVSISEDGNDDELSCPESQASALITELAQLKIEKFNGNQEKMLDLMDDFIEMERLASMSPRKVNGTIPEEKQSSGSTKMSVRKGTGYEVDMCVERDKIALEQILANREAELKAANRTCEEVSSKLALAEGQLELLRSKNAEFESSLVSPQENLFTIFDAHGEGANVVKVVKNVKASVGAPFHSVARLQAHVRWLSKGLYPGGVFSTELTECSELAKSPHIPSSADSCSGEESSSSMFTAEFKGSIVAPELTSAICKVVHIIEVLAVAITAHQSTIFPQGPSPQDYFLVDQNVVFANKYRHILSGELENIVGKFLAVSNQFLHGKVDMIKFMAELSFVLSHVTKMSFSAIDGSSLSCRKSHSEKSFTGAGEFEKLSGSNSPISETSKSDGSEREASRIVLVDENRTILKNGPSMVDVMKMEEELRKVCSEKAALESHMQVEFGRFVGIEEELSQLKADKGALENDLGEAKERLEHLKTQLQDAEQLVADLRLQLAFAEECKNLTAEQLSKVVTTKGQLQSQLKAKEIELNQLGNKVEVMEKDITKHQQRNEDLELMCQDLQKQLQNAMESSSQHTLVVEEERMNKEQEFTAAAEKLAECQRTILVLGKRLKALASPRGSTEISPNSSANLALPVESNFSGKGFLQIQHQQEFSKRDTDETGSSAHVSRIKGNSSGLVQKRIGTDGKTKLSWNLQDNISDIVDSELASISKRRPGSGRTILDLFGDKSLVHEDGIEVVAQMPSSPEIEPILAQKKVKSASRKKRSPHSCTGIDLSKSVIDAGSPAPSEKHGRSFSRFFSRTKLSQ